MSLKSWQNVAPPRLVFGLSQKIGNVSIGPRDAQGDLTAHLVFCTGERYVTQMNQRQSGIDCYIHWEYSRQHATGEPAVGARKYSCPSVAEIILTRTLTFQLETRKP